MLLDITNFIDGNGLICPNVVDRTVLRGSDNGITHTSRFVLLAQAPCNRLLDAVLKCIDSLGYVHRAPDDPTEDTPDDLYSLLSMLAVEHRSDIKVSLSWKQMHPVLIYLRLLKNDSLLQYLLSIPVAIVVALSNLGSDKSETSNRLLTWNIAQALKHRTVVGKLAAKVWEYRQKRIYGKISEIFAIYYGIGHPITELARYREV